MLASSRNILIVVEGYVRGERVVSPDVKTIFLLAQKNAPFFCQDPTDTKSLLVRPVVDRLLSSKLNLHSDWIIYPNLAPFEPSGQFLLVPSAGFPELPHFPQLMTKNLLEDMILITQNSKDVMIFFNSRHGGATQDHFHLQVVAYGNKFPIESANNYPIRAFVFEGEDAKGPRMWNFVKRFQFEKIPFNLIYLSNRFYLVPRNIEKEVVSEFPNLLASMEVCGRFIFSDKKAFDQATENCILNALDKIGLPQDKFEALQNET